MLVYRDFDNTIAGKPDKVPLKNWQPRFADWSIRDPTWKGGMSKGLILCLSTRVPRRDRKASANTRRMAMGS